MTHGVFVCERVQAMIGEEHGRAQPGPFCAESALPVGPSWGWACDSKVVCVCVSVCVCVWDKHSCCRGLYKCKEAVSVCFIRHTTDEGQVENPLHRECVRWACTKRGNKNREGAEWAVQRHRLPLTLLLFLSLSPLSARLGLAHSFLGCPNEMWASCRTMKRGSQGCFFTVPERQCASFNPMFQCKFLFHELPSPHVCNMAGFTFQPPRHYGYQG